MSVILSACRHTKQKAVARALKKRAEKQKLKKEAELQQLEASALEAFTKLWSFELNDEYYSVMLYLACDRDTVDIFCNDDEVPYDVTNVSSEGATFDFLIGSNKARIVAGRGEMNTGLVHRLVINGCEIPEVE